MNEDLDNIQFSLIKDYKYEQWFEETQYNGNTLSDTERKDLVVVIDETIDQYSKGLPLFYDILKNNKDLHDEYHITYCTVVSVMLFVQITMIDSMVASKYFLLADKDYDRRYMRGKLMVILNEGFKQLYGFEKNSKKTKWYSLSQVMNDFPEVVIQQFQRLSILLEKHATTSSWWKEERDFETHLDAEKLYESRQKEIIESKVMIDSVKLFNTLYAVDQFLTNMHKCLFNYMVLKYKQGEIKQ